MQKATQFLGLSISKSNWQQRLDIDKLLAGKLRYAPDSYAFIVFDNLGYDRKGGPLKSKRYETVVQSMKEFSWPDIRRICGADNADSKKMWEEKSRSTLSIESYLTSEKTYQFLDERWAAELGDAVVTERKICADVGGAPSNYSHDSKRFTCRNEIYGVGDSGPATSAAYQAAEIERQQQLVDEGDFLTLNNRNRLEPHAIGRRWRACHGQHGVSR